MKDESLASPPGILGACERAGYIAITFAMNVETRWRDGLKEILLRAVARGTCSAPEG